MTRFDETAGRYYQVDNMTGKSVEFVPTGQEKKRYDLKLSGIGSTKARKLKA